MAPERHGERLIAFGASIAGAEAYRRYAEPGVRRAREADSEVYAFAAVGVIARTYNLILDAAAAREDLEALVLVDAHTEILDPRFCAVVRDALADPAVAILGAAGATGVHSIAWWEGEVVAAGSTHRYGEHHGGEFPAYPWVQRRPAPAEVETVDGQLLVLSPWAVRNLRFDEGLVFGHGFDLDLCLAARAAGRRVLVADLPLRHHRSLELVADLPVWVEAHIRIAEKWGAALGGEVDGDAVWKRRARLAEARREANRTIAFSETLRLDAQVAELERELEAATSSLGWRLTEPLRRLNHWRREREQAAGGLPALEEGPSLEHAPDLVLRDH